MDDEFDQARRGRRARSALTRLTSRTVPQWAPSATGPSSVRRSLSLASYRLRRLLNEVTTQMSRRTGPSHHRDREPLSLITTLSTPQGTGVIGRDADGLLRTILVEALTCDPVRTVVVTKADLQRLLHTTLDADLITALAPDLYVTEALEDAIEHLESVADTPNHATRTGPDSSFVWLATPGADADVVHKTLREWPGLDLTGFFRGPWPYGPTHVIDKDNAFSHRLPVAFLSPEQTDTALQGRSRRTRDIESD